MSQIILKVQRPISSNCDKPEYFIYDKKREINFMVAQGNGLELLFKDDQLKVYINVDEKKLVNRNTLRIINVATDQHW